MTKDVRVHIENVKNGKCGIDNITAFDNTGYKTRVAAEVKDFNPKEFEISGSKKKDKFVQYALAAAYQANKNSKRQKIKPMARCVKVSFITSPIKL